MLKQAIPDPKTVKNFPHSNRKARIVSDRGRMRVIERLYYWDKEAGRGKEKRLYIGYVVGNEYFTNEQYNNLYKRDGSRRLVAKSQSSAAHGESALPMDFVASLEARQACEFPLYYAIAKSCGLIDDIETVWGKERAGAILSIAFQWLHTTSNAAYLYESWCQNKFLPYVDVITSRDMTDLLASLPAEPGWRKRFFGARIARLPENEVLCFDATEIATQAQEIAYAQLGLGKTGGFQQQIGLILLVGNKSGMPVLFRTLPGNITDVTTVKDMLFRFDELTDGKRVFAAVLDRGYCSGRNIASFIDANSRIVIAARTDISWVQEAVEEAMPFLWQSSSYIAGHECWGRSVAVEHKFEDGKERQVWVHVYRSDTKTHMEHMAFRRMLENFEKQWLQWKSTAKAPECPLLKSRWLKFFKGSKQPGTALEPDHEAIDLATRYFGFFCNITTMPCTAQEAIEIYGTRDLIEKTFKAGKSTADMSVVRSHREDTAEGRFIISFVAMTILSRLYALMKKSVTIADNKGNLKTLEPLAQDMSFNELKNYLEGIYMIFDGRGGRRWSEVTKKQHNIALRMGFPDLYTALPEWGPR